MYQLKRRENKSSLLFCSKEIITYINGDTNHRKTAADALTMEGKKT